MNLDTPVKNTWCPGCLNFGILNAAKKAIKELIEEGYDYHRFVLVSGIGCHAKIYDYININGFYSIHGRVLPTAIGIKLANKDLIVLGFGGDGDTYAEGIAHFVHACRYNADITMIVHNNQVFALTTGQPTPTTETGFKSKASPEGYQVPPLNPIALALVAGATFVARGAAWNVDHLAWLIKEGVKHKGFAFIDVLQPCITFHNTLPYLMNRVYDLQKEGHNVEDFEQAMEKALEWDYTMREDARIPIGIFYRVKRPILEEKI